MIYSIRMKLTVQFIYFENPELFLILFKHFPYLLACPFLKTGGNVVIIKNPILAPWPKMRQSRKITLPREFGWARQDLALLDQAVAGYTRVSRENTKLVFPGLAAQKNGWIWPPITVRRDFYNIGAQYKNPHLLIF